MWAFNSDTQERWAWKSSVFTPEECNMIINACKNNVNPATLYAKDGKTSNVDTSYRDSNTVFILPSMENNWIFQRIGDAVMEINNNHFRFDLTGFAEGLQFTEYKEPGGKYDLHVDKVFNGIIRKLSVVVQLSDPATFDGGDFHYQDSTTVEVLPKSQGMALAFPSYALHGVTPVTRGVRYTLVGWVTGPNFK